MNGHLLSSEHSDVYRGSTGINFMMAPLLQSTDMMMCLPYNLDAKEVTSKDLLAITHHSPWFTFIPFTANILWLQCIPSQDTVQ